MYQPCGKTIVQTLKTEAIRPELVIANTKTTRAGKWR